MRTSTDFLCRLAFSALLGIGLKSAANADPPSQREGSNDMVFNVSMQVDLGEDIGQNFGALFEAADAQGHIVAGAGFLGLHNTDARSDRRVLHVFVKPPTGNDAFTVQKLPKPSNDAGVYLNDFDRKLFARGRGGRKDDRLRFWDEAAQRWVVDDKTVPLSIHVGDGVLALVSNQVTYKDKPILQLDPDQATIGEPYYANGIFVFRQYDRNRTPWLNNLVACPWTPGRTIDPAEGHILNLRTAVEFVYGCGQLGQAVVITTNMGGVYVFENQNWKVLLEPDEQTSFQIYSAVNYYDTLLLGQYPTGELYEFDGTELRLRKGWPPVMEGVSTHAREAQTTAIYGGDLYVGVWPWAEVWKYDRNRSDWILVRRMFTHPEITDATTHPYENETAALGEVLNRWGQRVTGMVPFGASLYISTSAKGSHPYEPKFGFLSDDKWQEYGTVYKLTAPGHLSVYTEWKDGPTRFGFTLTRDSITVTQDGVALGSLPLSPELTSAISPKDITWGYGIYGKFRGEIIEKTLEQQQ